MAGRKTGLAFARPLLLVLVTGLHGGAAVASPNNHVGLNVHHPTDDVLDAAKDLGVGWVRIDFNWYQLQPKAGSAPDFKFFDKMINAALARGLKVFPSLGYSPAWAAEPDKDGKPHNNAPKVGEYYKICKAAAAHYKGKITHWGLWNEPNIHFFEGTRQQWIDRVVIEGIKGIKAGCPACKVLGPEIAGTDTKSDQWLDDSLKALKKAGLMYDVITWHIYSSFLELSPGWWCWDEDLFVHDLDQHRVCWWKTGNLSVREVLLKHGLGKLPIWITETGYKAPLGDKTETANQVTFYRRVLEEQLKRPWWTHTFFYEAVDDNASTHKWGMAARTGSSFKYPGSYQLKPVWGLLKQALAAQPALGGKGGDCNDGLDNDGDKLIDYPKDPGCASASDPTETTVSSKPDTGIPDSAPVQPDSALPDTVGALPGADLSRDSATVEGGQSGQDTATSRDSLPVRDVGEGGRDATMDHETSPGDQGCACTVQSTHEPLFPGWVFLAFLFQVHLRTRRVRDRQKNSPPRGDQP